jgi:hypothetical protein
VRNSNTFGVLALTLTASGWSTSFVPEAGATFTDSASGTCRVPGTTTTTPTTVAAEPDSRVSNPFPNTTIGSPATFTGTATAAAGVNRVRVSIRNQATQLWLQDDGTFGSTFRQFDATLALPGATSTSWTLTRALPNAGYGVGTKAVDTAGRTEAVTPWVTFAVSGSSPPTTPPPTAPPSSAPPPTAPPPTGTTTTTSTTSTTTPPSGSVDDEWAFWGYLYSDGQRQSNGTWRWDQAPYRYSASAARFVRGAQAANFTVRLDASGAYYTNQSIPALRDPTNAGAAAIRAYLAATIEDEATCLGMVYDNPQLSVVQYVQSLYTAVNVPTRRVTYSGGFNELFVDQPNWSLIGGWPYATTVRTPGASNCNVNAK